MTPIEVSRRERKKDETRERIQRAALELFRERGFETTTVDEIAARADVAKGTFFNYFPRKEAVLGAMLDERMERLEGMLDALVLAPGSVREKLLKLAADGTTTYRHEPEISRYMLLELLKGPVSLLREKDQRAQAAVRRLIEAGQASGELRSDIDLERATALFRGVFFHTMLHHVFDPTTFDPPTEVRARIEMLLDGLMARTGAR